MMVQGLIGFAVVIGLLLVTLKLVQRYGRGGSFLTAPENRATILSVTYVDDSTKLILANFGKKKYLFAIAKHTSLLLDKYEDHE